MATLKAVPSVRDSAGVPFNTQTTDSAEQEKQAEYKQLQRENVEDQKRREELIPSVPETIANSEWLAKKYPGLREVLQAPIVSSAPEVGVLAKSEGIDKLALTVLTNKLNRSLEILLSKFYPSDSIQVADANMHLFEEECRAWLAADTRAITDTVEILVEAAKAAGMADRIIAETLAVRKTGEVISAHVSTIKQEFYEDVTCGCPVGILDHHVTWMTTKLLEYMKDVENGRLLDARLHPWATVEENGHRKDPASRTKQRPRSPIDQNFARIYLELESAGLKGRAFFQALRDRGVPSPLSLVKRGCPRDILVAFDDRKWQQKLYAARYEITRRKRH